MGGLMVANNGALAAMTHTSSLDLLSYCARPPLAPWGAGDLWDETAQAKAQQPQALVVLMLPLEVATEMERGSFATEPLRRLRKLAGVELGEGPSTAEVNRMVSLMFSGETRASKGWVG